MDPTMPMDENVFQLGLLDLLFNIVGIILDSFLTGLVVPAFNGFFQGLSALFAVPM